MQSPSELSAVAEELQRLLAGLQDRFQSGHVDALIIALDRLEDALVRFAPEAAAATWLISELRMSVQRRLEGTAVGRSNQLAQFNQQHEDRQRFWMVLSLTGRLRFRGLTIVVNAADRQWPALSARSCASLSLRGSAQDVSTCLVFGLIPVSRSRATVPNWMSLNSACELVAKERADETGISVSPGAIRQSCYRVLLRQYGPPKSVNT